MHIYYVSLPYIFPQVISHFPCITVCVGSPDCPTRASSKRGSGLAIPPWAIALILILLLLLLGLLALALLKLLLMLLVSP